MKILNNGVTRAAFGIASIVVFFVYILPFVLVFVGPLAMVVAGVSIYYIGIGGTVVAFFALVVLVGLRRRNGTAYWWQAYEDLDPLGKESLSNVRRRHTDRRGYRV